MIDIITKELNLDNLDTTILRLECNGNEKNEKFKVVNRILGQIKKGKLEQFIIPNKVEIYIERKYLNIPTEVSKIIDTRGISSETTKVSNSIVAREDLDNYINDDSSLVIYVNEFSSIERPVVDFFYDRLTSPKTNPEDIVKFLVLINTRNGSIESKVDDEDVEEFLYDKKSEFKNAVLLSEQNESLKNLKIKENYKKINELISQSNGEVANFIFYHPLMGMKKETENSKNFFKVDNEQICADNREKICAEFQGLICLRNKIISSDLDAKVKIARMYISNELRLSSNTELGSMITDFEEGIKEKAQNMISEFLYKYFTDLINLTGRMDGRTVAAYVRGNGYVVSRNETMVDDIYYWHKNMKRDLAEKLELVLESETKLFEEKSIVFKDYMTGVKALEILQTTVRNDVQKYIDYISKELIDGLKNHLVGNGIFWNDVRASYTATYASALKSVISRNFDSRYINTTTQNLISQKY